MSSASFRYKMVIAVRTDLKLSKGKTAVQVAHAAVVCALNSRKKHPILFKKWLSEGQKKVVVKVSGLKELYQLKKEAEDLGITTALISDAGLTEVEPGTVTCLGIGPDKEEIIDRVTGELQLL